MCFVIRKIRNDSHSTPIRGCLPSPWRENRWKNPIVVRLDFGANQSLDFLFEEEGQRRSMSMMANLREQRVPHAVIRMKNMLSNAQAVPIDFIIQVFCTGEVMKNNRQLLKNIGFMKQQFSFVSSPITWSVLTWALAIYFGTFSRD